MGDVPLPTTSATQTDVNLAGQSLESVQVQESTPIAITSDLPLDVSGATVTVDDNGTFDIDSLPEPLDVSDATLTVTDDGSLAISSLPEPLSVEEPLDVSASTVTVTDDGTLTIDSLQDTDGNAVDPAESGPQGNWENGYDESFTPSDTTVTALSSGAVPDGVEVVVQSDPNNNDPVYVGLSSSPAVAVSPGSAYTAQVSDRSQIRVQTQTSGDTVNISHEAA